MTNTTYHQADETDGPRLAELRVQAMRASLEALGRFDPGRARARFLDHFSPAETWRVEQNGEIAAFFTLRRRADHFLLDHLYVAPKSQGSGLGRAVIVHIQDQARAAGLPIRLMALKQSAANTFYVSCGFFQIGEEEFDIRYQWLPQTKNGPT